MHQVSGSVGEGDQVAHGYAFGKVILRRVISSASMQ